MVPQCLWLVPEGRFSDAKKLSILGDVAGIGKLLPDDEGLLIHVSVRTAELRGLRNQSLNGVDYFQGYLGNRVHCMLLTLN